MSVFAYGLIGPVLALAAWTLVMWVWMYATRLPAISAAKIDPQAAKHPGSLAILPTGARQVADNYNHLHEQPTVFYAVALALAMTGQGGDILVSLAWAYVGLRVLHSLIQCTVNIVPLRFVVFSLGTFALMGLLGLGVMGLLQGGAGSP
jgi:hypothetical protein